MSLVVGTAGWSIPASAAAQLGPGSSALARYATRFDGVEINSSFHGPHRRATWQRWAESVPAWFRFAVKIPKAISHQRKLVQCDDLVARFLDEAGGLGDKLAILLLQLPPKLAFDPVIAEPFLTGLAAVTSARLVCEPRHPSWFEPVPDALLASLGVARVAADPAILPAGLPRADGGGSLTGGSTVPRAPTARAMTTVASISTRLCSARSFGPGAPHGAYSTIPPARLPSETHRASWLCCRRWNARRPRDRSKIARKGLNLLQCSNKLRVPALCLREPIPDSTRAGPLMTSSKAGNGPRRPRRRIHGLAAPKNVVDRLSDLPMTADNPGNLRARIYLPDNLARAAPLVVVLHGCTQSAAIYDHGSGWSRLADRNGFALLFPEQQRANNMNLCFNWYQPGDAVRGEGEAASIRAMVAHMVAAHGVDPSRIFVTGLSAGGAMTSVMLATYPEIFAAGAIIAGLPYGSAATLGEALGAMSAPGSATESALGAAVRQASPHRGPWPRISIWHGTADRLVVPANSEAIVRQWRDVHGLGARPTRIDDVDGYLRRIWAGPSGDVLVENYRVTGMAHGTPLMPGREEGQSGEAGAHMLDVGLSSTDRIAAFFGIAPEPAMQTERPHRPAEHPATAANDVQEVIENALRAAGLMH